MHPDCLRDFGKSVATKRTVTTTTTQEITLNREAVLNLLRKSGIVGPTDPDNSVRVYVVIPSGGDYSGESLEVGEDVPLQVTIETVEKKHG